MRVLATALEYYRAEYDAYPPMIPMREVVDSIEDLERIGGGGLTTIDTRFPKPEGFVGQRGLVGKPLLDPYSPGGNFPYAYFHDDTGWFLHSPGPNRVYNITDPTEVYDGSIPQPSLHLTSGPWTYDPTNGLESAGDIWRVSQ